MTINKEYIKNTLILCFLLKALVGSINISTNFFYQKEKSTDHNNKEDKIEAKKGIDLQDEINRDKLICKSNKVSSQHWLNLVFMTALYILSYI